MEVFYIVQLEPKHDPLRIKFGKSDKIGSERELAARTYCPYAEVLRLYSVSNGSRMEQFAETLARTTYGASRPGQKQVLLSDAPWLPRNRRLYASKNGKTRVAKRGVGKELLRFKSWADLQNFLKDITKEVGMTGGQVQKSSKPQEPKQRKAVKIEKKKAEPIDRSGEPVRWSHLKHMRTSPAHYLYYRDVAVEESAAMRVGAFVHKMILGGPRQFVVFPGKTRRGKAWDVFEGEHVGETILNSRESNLSHAIANALHHDRQAMEVLGQGAKEETLNWTINGRKCSGTPDVLGEGLTELKVSMTADPSRIYWHAKRMGWLGQLGWYANGAKEAGVIDEEHPGLQHITLVAVEPKPPHVVTVFDLTQDDIDEANATWWACWERLMTCEEASHFPGYTDNVVARWDRPEAPTTIIMDGEEVEV